MTLDAVKDEAIRLLGPERSIVEALSNKGYPIAGAWENEDDGSFNVVFNRASAFHYSTIEFDLRLIGDAVQFELIAWGAPAKERPCECQAIYKKTK